MKKFLIPFLLILAFVTTANAQEKYGTYYSSYFEKELDVMASSEVGTEPDIFIQVLGKTSYDEVYLRFNGEDISFLNNSLRKIKEKYIEWRTVAKNNRVKSLNKEFNVDMPRATVAWYGSKWWFNFQHKLTPRFIVTENLDYIFVLTDTVTASGNDYIDTEYYLVLANEHDFDNLINVISLEKAKKHFRDKQKQTDLFK